MVENWYSFPAIQGIQARNGYYVIMVPLKVIPKLFSFEDEDFPVHLRAQRTLNKGRVPQIAKYMLDNPNEYILSSLTASIDGVINFIPVSKEENGIGTLKISMSSKLYINDGQHRRAAIEEAIKHRKFLGDETISVVLYSDQGLKRSQQMFADLNINPVKPAQSIKLLFNHRDEHKQITQAIIDNSDLFKGFTEYERSNIPGSSNALFTFSALHSANKTLLNGIDTFESIEDKVAAAAHFWSTVTKFMDQWSSIQNRSVNASELRESYISVHGIALQAIAVVGNSLLNNKTIDIDHALSGLSNIDWSRVNTDWNGRALNLGKISKSKININLVAAYIFSKIGLDVPSPLKELEIARLN